MMHKGKPEYVQETCGADQNGCRWDEANDFCEGLARVKRDGKWGFIDRTGRLFG